MDNLAMDWGLGTPPYSAQREVTNCSCSFCKPEGFFANIILYNDGFLALRENLETESDQKANRYFKIAKQLPIELQMILANRTGNNPKNIIRAKDLEPVLKEIVREYKK